MAMLGRHRVDAHAVLGRLHRRTAGESHDPGLGRGVVRLQRLGAPTQHEALLTIAPRLGGTCAAAWPGSCGIHW